MLVGPTMDAGEWDARILDQAKRLLDGLSELWAKAEPRQRAEIVGGFFREVRAREQGIFQVTLLI